MKKSALKGQFSPRLFSLNLLARLPRRLLGRSVNLLNHQRLKVHQVSAPQSEPARQIGSISLNEKQRKSGKLQDQWHRGLTSPNSPSLVSPPIPASDLKVLPHLLAELRLERVDDAGYLGDRDRGHHLSLQDLRSGGCLLI